MFLDPFTEEDFIKLWKGLHYCLWMQDKPLLQVIQNIIINTDVNNYSMIIDIDRRCGSTDKFKSVAKVRGSKSALNVCALQVRETRHKCIWSL